jgi:phosphatidate cytidylyltransferase
MGIIKRILTASFWVPTTFLLLQSDLTWFYFLTLVCALGTTEYFNTIAHGLRKNVCTSSRMYGQENPKENQMILIALGVCLSLVASMGSATIFSSATVFTMLSVLGYHFALRWLPLGNENASPTAADVAFFLIDLLGMILVPWGFSHLSLLRGHQEYGLAYTAITIGAAWSADTGALFFGKMFGRYTPRLMPAISPNKTVAGFAGAILSSVGVLFLVSYLASIGMFFPIPKMLNWHSTTRASDLAVVGVVFGLTSVVGDAIESVLKRASEIKDSGEFFPGHGGFLDKIDSITMTAIVFYHFVAPLLE